MWAKWLLNYPPNQTGKQKSSSLHQLAWSNCRKFLRLLNILTVFFLFFHNSCWVCEWSQERFRCQCQSFWGTDQHVTRTVFDDLLPSVAGVMPCGVCEHIRQIWPRLCKCQHAVWSCQDNRTAPVSHLWQIIDLSAMSGGLWHCSLKVDALYAVSQLGLPAVLQKDAYIELDLEWCT